MWIGTSEHVRGDPACTVVTVTDDGVGLTPAQARRLAGYLLEAVDVAERGCGAQKHDNHGRDATDLDRCSGHDGFEDVSGDLIV